MRSGEIVGGLALMLIIAALGIGIGWGIGTTVPPPAGTVTVSSTSSAASSSSASSSSTPFVLTLVVTTGNIYNSTVGEQPAYYVLGPHGIESAASISLPAHRLIELVIVDYDDGAANLTGSQYATVSGTQNNSVTEVSNENVNSSQSAAGIQVSGGETVSSLPADGIAHTFTIPQLGINIPLAPSSTVVAYFTLNQTGTFTWFCMTICGSGPNGLGGAMATAGWMSGNVVAS
jgi:plastocyanin